MGTAKNIKKQNTSVSNNYVECKKTNKKQSVSKEEISESNENILKSNETSERNKNISEPNDISRKRKLFIYLKVYLLFIVCILAVLTPLFLERYKRNSSKPDNLKPKYWAYSKGGQHLLKHVHRVLKRLGYEQVPENSTTDWDLFWSRDYPFGKDLNSHLLQLQDYQRVNHIPGISHLTQKHILSITESKYIPKSFELPEDKERFLEYAKKNKDALFVQKLNTHRGILLKNASDMDFSGLSFAQEFIKNPLLIDGYKFDIGIYMVLTSVDPLRIYWYKEDVLLRFCPHKYHPLDPSDLDQYVIRDSYKPTWEIPSLAYAFNGLKLGMKGSFDTYLRALHIDPEVIWDKITEAITHVFLMKEHHIVNELKHRSPKNFFEMTRVDLMLDDDFNVYVVEINFSPNLVADDKPTNQLLYEQLLYNTFRITGIANRYKSKDKQESSMISAPKNIATWGNNCVLNCIQNCEQSVYCGLCLYCRTASTTATLEATHTENLNKGAFRRLFPPRLTPGTTSDALLPIVDKFTESNQLLYFWYQGKCNDDITWCA